MRLSQLHENQPRDTEPPHGWWKSMFYPAVGLEIDNPIKSLTDDPEIHALIDKQMGDGTPFYTIDQVNRMDADEFALSNGEAHLAARYLGAKSEEDILVFDSMQARKKDGDVFEHVRETFKFRQDITPKNIGIGGMEITVGDVDGIKVVRFFSESAMHSYCCFFTLK
jgi:hypothetical protein